MKYAYGRPSQAAPVFYVFALGRSHTRRVCMNSSVRYTLSQQKALRAAQVLSDALSGINTETGVQARMQAFFASVWHTEPDVRSEGMLKRVTLTREQLDAVGALAPDALPDLGIWFREPLEHPMQYAECGMSVAILDVTKHYSIRQISATRRLGKTDAVQIASYWFSLDGVHITQSGEPSKRQTGIEAVLPLTPLIVEEIERQNILVELTGYHRASVGRNPLLYQAPLHVVRTVRHLLRTWYREANDGKMPDPDVPHA